MKNMDIKEILYRVGYVRNQANLSLRELSLRIGMSPQYMIQVERGRIVLTMEKLLSILEVCEFPLERFFAPNIQDWEIDNELCDLIEKLATPKKQNLIEFLKN